MELPEQTPQQGQCESRQTRQGWHHVPPGDLRSQRRLLSEPIEPLLADESVSEIMVNGYDDIYIERRAS